MLYLLLSVGYNSAQEHPGFAHRLVFLLFLVRRPLFQLWFAHVLPHHWFCRRWFLYRRYDDRKVQRVCLLL